MTVRIVHKNSSESGKNPTGSQLANGELAVNYNADGPFLSVKDTNGRVVRVGGVWVNGSAPGNPAHGALWVDIDNNTLHIYDADAGAWRLLSGSGGGGGAGGAVDQVTGGNGITAAPTTGNVIVSADIDTNRGLEFQGGNIAVNLGTGLQFDGTGQIEATSQPLTYRGAVDCTNNTTQPSDAAVGNVYTVSKASVNASDPVTNEWYALITNLASPNEVAVGDMLACTTAASGNAANARYTHIPTGGLGRNTDLAVANRTATTLDITSSTGVDATVPFADHDEAGLFIEPNNPDNSTVKNYVRRSNRAADGVQTHSWQESTATGTVTSITPGNGLQNGNGAGTKDPITGAGTLAVDLEAAGAGTGGLTLDNGEIRVDVHAGLELTANGVGVDLEAAGAGTGGLEFDNNEIRVNAGDGIELTANGVSADLQAAGAGTGGLELTATDGTGEIRVDAGDGIALTANGVSADLLANGGLRLTATDGTGELAIDAANMPAPGNNQAFGYWQRANGTATLSPRTANDNIDNGSGDITTTGDVQASDFIIDQVTADVTISAANPAAARTYSFPDEGGNRDITLDPANPAADADFIRRKTNAGVGSWVPAAQVIAPIVVNNNLLYNMPDAPNQVINQRGYTNGTGVGAANQYTIDRWRVVTGGQGLSWTTNHIDNFQFTCPGDGIEQEIPAADLNHGLHTISWAGTATCQIGINGNALAAINNGATFNITNTAANLTVRWSGGTLSQAKIERGTVPTPYIAPVFATEKARCALFYERMISEGRSWILPSVVATQAVAPTARSHVYFPFVYEKRDVANAASISVVRVQGGTPSNNLAWWPNNADGDNAAAIETVPPDNIFANRYGLIMQRNENVQYAVQFMEVTIDLEL